jgi:hypothetical protein
MFRERRAVYKGRSTGVPSRRQRFGEGLHDLDHRMAKGHTPGALITVDAASRDNMAKHK